MRRDRGRSWQVQRTALRHLMLMMLRVRVRVRMSRLLNGRVRRWTERAVTVAAAGSVGVVSRERVRQRQGQRRSRVVETMSRQGQRGRWYRAARSQRRMPRRVRTLRRRTEDTVRGMNGGIW